MNENSWTKAESDNEAFVNMMTVEKRRQAIEVLSKIFPSESISFWMDSEARGQNVNLQIKGDEISASLQLPDSAVRFILHEASGRLESRRDSLAGILDRLQG